MFGELLSIIAPVYVTAALGYGWARSGRPYDNALITDLIMNISAPCLVFSSLARVAVEPEALAQMALLAPLALLCFAAVGAVVLRLAGLPMHTFLSPLIFVNAGNMGLPLCLFAFGDEGLALGVVFFAVCALSQFTVGQWLWSGGMPLGQLARTPLVFAVVGAAAVVTFEWQVPLWLLRTTQLLGGFAIPLMQFSLGVSLAGFSLAHVPRTVGLSLLRLGLGLGVGIGVSQFFELQGVVRAVFILDCAMPAAVFNYLLAARYQRSPEQVASLVAVSTLLSFAVVPLLLTWLL